MKNILPKINKIHKSCLITNYGIDGHDKIDDLWEGITMYGKGYGGFQEDFVPSHIKDFQADVFIPIYDVWAFAQIPTMMVQNKIPWIPYCPIDADRLNPGYRRCLQTAHKIIPMSLHSELQLKKYFPDKTMDAIQPGVDLNIYKPLWETIEQKNSLKSNFGLKDDNFVVSMMGDIKQWRKSWAENIEGFKIFRDNNPDAKAWAYIHTAMRPENVIDFNIAQLAHEIGIDDTARMVETYAYAKGVSDNGMATAYNMSDVFLQASRGEGFGMGFVEAAACGTPSIGTNHSSMTETVIDGKTGHLVKPVFEYFDQSCGKKAIPDPFDIADKLELIFKKGSTKYKDECLKHANNYTWEISITKWLKALDEIQNDVIENALTIPKNYECLKDDYEIMQYG